MEKEDLKKYIKQYKKEKDPMKLSKILESFVTACTEECDFKSLLKFNHNCLPFERYIEARIFMRYTSICALLYTNKFLAVKAEFNSIKKSKHIFSKIFLPRFIQVYFLCQYSKKNYHLLEGIKQMYIDAQNNIFREWSKQQSKKKEETLHIVVEQSSPEEILFAYLEKLDKVEQEELYKNSLNSFDACIAYSKGNYYESNELFSKLLQYSEISKPSKCSCHYNIALCELKLGNRQRAKTSLQYVVKYANQMPIRRDATKLLQKEFGVNW